jgi:twitching motility protein PilT
MLAMLPKEEREIGRVRFAAALRGVIAQQLVPRIDGSGRVAVVEVLVSTSAVRDAIRDPARVDDLVGLMASGEGDMTTFTRHAQALVAAGIIGPETARVIEGGEPAPVKAVKSRRKEDR